jgi:hypothetical protein
MRPFKILAVALSTLLVAVAVHAGNAKNADPELSARMAVIVNSLRFVLPHAGSAERLAASVDDPSVSNALQVISAEAEMLSGHLLKADPTLRHQGRALASDARAAKRQYDRELYSNARLTIEQLTDRCFSCHARLPSGDSQLARVLVDFSELKDLSNAELARVKVATRRFDSALSSFEKHFDNRKLDVNKMDAEWRDYLSVAIAVKQDPARALRALDTFAKRGQMNPTTKLEVAAWRAALEKLKKAQPSPTLAAARAWVKEGEEVADNPADRRALVHWIAASSALHRYLDAQDTGARSRALAEAFLLTVRTDYRVQQSYPVALAEDYLEAAIRAAPKSKTAKSAYSTLEQVSKAAHADDQGKIPDDVTARLKELARLSGS